MKRPGKRRRVWKVGTLARIGLVVGIIVLYSLYSLTSKSAVEVATIQQSPTDVTVLVVTLRNPTFKFVTGQLLSITTEVDIPPSPSGSPRILESVPQTYPFTLFPQGSTQLNVAMNFKLLAGVQYDVVLQIDGVGQNTTSLTLPKS